MKLNFVAMLRMMGGYCIFSTNMCWNLKYSSFVRTLHAPHRSGRYRLGLLKCDMLPWWMQQVRAEPSACGNV